MRRSTFHAIFDSLSWVYNNISYIGIQYYRYGKRLTIFIVNLLIKPLKFVLLAFLSLFSAINRFTFRTFRSILDEVALLRIEIKNSKINLKRAFKHGPLAVAHIFVYYIKRAYVAHKSVFKYFANLVLPAVAAIVLFLTINSWSNVTFALEININDGVIGYVSSESVYMEARELAKERLSIGSGPADSQMLDSPAYSVSLISINQLTDAKTISDKLIENSNSHITHACGIFIDDEFLCAVKNETDARRVFDSVMAPYEEKEEYSVVSFVEKIDYVQGLYPDNEDVMWDATRLAKKLNSKKQEANYYNVQSGDTLLSIAGNFDVSVSDIKALNQNVSETNLQIGTELLISDEVKFVRVQTAKVIVYNEDIPFETVEIETDAYYKGTKRVVREGVKGQMQVTALVTYIDDVPISNEIVSSVVTKEPVSKRVQVGTKAVSSGSSSGSVVRNPGSVFVWPAVNANVINSGFGYRNGAMHRGLDIVAASGSSRGRLIVAAGSGIVTKVTRHYSWGNYIMIDHGNGLQTLYAHCLEGSMSVRVGQRVNAGQSIARIGSTGNSSGYHLHFEVWRNGVRVDPKPYLGVR